MARSAFYEESAISTRERSERRTYQVFHIASIVVLVIAAFYLLFLMTYIPSVLSSEEMGGAAKAIDIIEDI